MAGPRQPTELLLLKGNKHFTKAEIQERLDREVKPITDEIEPPSILTKKQKEEFIKISNQLQKLKIMGETDVDALARYIIAKDFYNKAVKKMRSKEVSNDPLLFDLWSKNQERYFKQCRSSANDLGLSISSRCKLVVPEKNEAPPKTNKFTKFEKGPVGSA